MDEERPCQGRSTCQVQQQGSGDGSQRRRRRRRRRAMWRAPPPPPRGAAMTPGASRHDWTVRAPQKTLTHTASPTAFTKPLNTTNTRARAPGATATARARCCRRGASSRSSCARRWRSASGATPRASTSARAPGSSRASRVRPARRWRRLVWLALGGGRAQGGSFSVSCAPLAGSSPGLPRRRPPCFRASQWHARMHTTHNTYNTYNTTKPSPERP